MSKDKAFVSAMNTYTEMKVLLVRGPAFTEMAALSKYKTTAEVK